MENLVILFAFFCAFESIDYFFKPIGFFVLMYICISALLLDPQANPVVIFKGKTYRLKNRSKRGGPNSANQTHKRKEINIFWPP